MKHSALKNQQEEALWRKAEASGMARRTFLVLLASSGAAAVLAACTPKTPTLTPTPAPTTTPIAPTPPASPTATASPSPSPTATLPAIIEPTPTQFFNILGSNVEMRFEVMANRGYTVPNSLFFVRNHTATPFPAIDIKTWALSIEGDGVAKPLTLSYDDLLAMPSVTVTRFVECAGNGRGFFDTMMKQVATGGQWHLGAYGVAEWTGVPLSAILDRAGIKSNAVDVMPVGLDSTKVERPMPVAKAKEPDTIVAYMMNGDILPLDHGFPARVLAPGWVGVNSVKWVGRIVVSTTPILTEKNTTNYVLIGPDYKAQGDAKGPPVTTQVLKSACCLPFPAALKSGPQKITGYAWSPFGKISKVDVSLDDGKTFQPATLTGPNIERAGSRWEFSFTAQAGSLTITPRATDDQGNAQYPVAQQKWNQLGYLFGAMVPHPVTVT